MLHNGNESSIVIIFIKTFQLETVMYQVSQKLTDL